jgi:hypothetical protein
MDSQIGLLAADAAPKKVDWNRPTTHDELEMSNAIMIYGHGME